MSDVSLAGDSSELEALFDSIVDKHGNPGAGLESMSPPAPKTRANDAMTDDSEDLQALFDAVAEQAVADGEDDSKTDWSTQDKVFLQVGQMTRQLHNTLGALGYDKLIEKTVSALPDAKDRLAYIANLTEQAACKVLNATDVATPLQEQLESDAAVLGAQWDALFANRMGVDEFKQLAMDTRSFLHTAVPQRTAETKKQLMEIMMAQDFQDLTGQVIKKVVGLAQDLESQLMALLIETMPGEKRTESVNSLLNGPVVNAAGRTDIVAGQQQVDDLLDSLGF